MAFLIGFIGPQRGVKKDFHNDVDDSGNGESDDCDCNNIADDHHSSYNNYDWDQKD